MILERTYEYILKLPHFRGKARIDEALRHFLRPKASRIIHDIAMELDPEEWLQIDLRKFCRLEPKTTAAFERILKHGGICVDVGAHIGYHAMLACHLVGTSGQVFAIDPQPYNCNRLLINAGLNRFANCTVVVAAVGCSEGFVSLKKQSRRDASRLTVQGSGPNDEAVLFLVPLITLAWLFRRYALHRVDLLKLDVEGSELEVLQGIRETLDSIENIIFEILPGEDQYRAQQIEALLRASGFQLFDMDGNEWHCGLPCVENNVLACRTGMSNPCP